MARKSYSKIIGSLTKIITELESHEETHRDNIVTNRERIKVIEAQSANSKQEADSSSKCAMKLREIFG